MFATTLYRALRAHQKRRRAFHDLSGMEDSVLKDIGISRSDIFSLVYGPGDDWRKRR